MQHSAGAAPVSGALAPKRRQTRLLTLMMSMFFAFGFCTVLVDTLVPKFKAMFALSYTEVMLTQFCYFGAYFVCSAPAGWLLSRIGYLPSITLGLLLMAAGALGFAPAALLGTYPGFLAALFVLAAGVAIVQVAANPVTALAGPEDRAPSRLTLAQALNSVATMVGPQFGAFFILSHVAAPPAGLSAMALAAFRQQQAHVFVAPFVGIGVALLALAALCWRVRAWSPPAAPQGAGGFFRLLRERRLLLGAVSIFTYVGAEVSIGSSIANYLMQASVLGLAAASAGRLVSAYWGGAMVGRFIGSAVLQRVAGGLALAVCAIAACALAVTSSLSAGMMAAVTLLAIGLCNAIMFPTIFTLAIEGLGEDTPEASGLICLAIVGGALVPLLTGFVADHAGLSHAMLVPAVCYVWIALYGVLVWRGTISAPVPAIS
jgi:FHS family L-fucose permease-like MFS transporter